MGGKIMRSALYTGAIIALAFTICVAWSSGAGAARTQQEDVGPIAGTVVAPNGERGAVVKAGPSESDRTLGYLRTGTKVQNYLDFRNGWVRVRNPFHGAWIPASYIEPQSGPATVARVDQPENCLKVRDGPGSQFEVVGCLAKGDTLTLTGYWTKDNWAQVSAPIEGWVYAGQITTNLAPSYQPRAVPVRRASGVSYPVYYEGPIIEDDDVYDYYYDYAYPVLSYAYGGYPWYWWWNRYHNKRYYGKRFWQSRGRYGRDWIDSTGRSTFGATGGRPGPVFGAGVDRRGGPRLGVTSGRGGTRVGVTSGRGRDWIDSTGLSTLGATGGRPGPVFGAGVDRRGRTRLGVTSGRGGSRVGVTSDRGGSRIGVASGRGGPRLGISSSSGRTGLGISRGGGVRFSAPRSAGFSGGGFRGGSVGRIGGMSMRSGGGGGRGGFRR